MQEGWEFRDLHSSVVLPGIIFWLDKLIDSFFHLFTPALEEGRYDLCTVVYSDVKRTTIRTCEIDMEIKIMLESQGI